MPPRESLFNSSAGTARGPRVGVPGTLHARQQQASALSVLAADWLTVTAADGFDPITGRHLYTLWFRDQDGGSEAAWTNVGIFADCFSGNCACKFTVGGVPTQLRPCRFTVKALLEGDPIPGWDYVMAGVLFGFKIVDSTCTSEYTCPNIPHVNHRGCCECLKTIAYVDLGDR